MNPQKKKLSTSLTGIEGGSDLTSHGPTRLRNQPLACPLCPGITWASLVCHRSRASKVCRQLFRQRYTRSADDVDQKNQTQTAKRGVSMRAVTFFSAEMIFFVTVEIAIFFFSRLFRQHRRRMTDDDNKTGWTPVPKSCTVRTVPDLTTVQKVLSNVMKIGTNILQYVRVR